MKPVHLVLTVVFAVMALSFVVWLGRYEGQITVAPPQVAPVGADELPIPTTGPYGKAVAPELSFNFGTVEKGDTGSHVFRITNEGAGVLRVKAGKTSCPQCTIGNVSRDDDIPPGETVDVEIKWKISSTHPNFRQTAEIFTTDPQSPRLEFAIEGTIDTPLHLVPSEAWQLGELSETDPVTMSGMLYSATVKEFTIEKADSSNPLVTVTWEPASDEALEEKKAVAGFKIKVTIAPGTAVGPLRETIKLHTDLRGGTDIDFSLAGKRPGPIEVKGIGINLENNVVLMGEFPADQGAKKKFTMYVRNFDGDLDAQQVDADKARARVQVSSTGRVFGNSRIYDVVVEVPAGVPSERRYKNAEPAVLKLNHPEVSEFKMYVDYFAR